MAKYERQYNKYVSDELKSQINKKNVEAWNKYLNGKRKLAEKTREQYTSDVYQLFVYILKEHDNIYIFDIDEYAIADILEGFFSMCTYDFNNSNRRLSRRMSTISSMFIFYKKKRLIKLNPVELLERPEIKAGIGVMTQTFLSQDQVKTIRENLERENNLQLTLFFELALYTMLRVNALSEISIPNIDLDNKKISNIIEKEGYNVTASISDKIVELIKQWLSDREADSELLFVNKFGNNAKSSMQSRWIKKIGSWIGIPELHVHDLRHSGSDLRFRAGQSLESVSKALNHAGTDVTKKHYLTEDEEKLAEEMLKFEI